jgi:hypothetical protein
MSSSSVNPSLLGPSVPPKPSLLDTAVENIYNFREMLDFASINLEEKDPICGPLKKLDAFLEKAIDPKDFNAIQKQKDVRKAYGEIKKVADEFIAAHGEQCGLESLEELK